MRSDAGGPASPRGAPIENSILGRQGWLTIARTLKLACVLVLIAFLTFMATSYLIVQSIDNSFVELVEVERPSLDAAKQMDDSADESMIAFLESLVTDRVVSSKDAEVTFARSVEDYEALLRISSEQNGLSSSATELFGRLKQWGRELVASDRQRRDTFIEVQRKFEALDDRVEEIPILSTFEGDIEQSARMVSNYTADPSAHNKEAALAEFPEFREELQEAREGVDDPSKVAALASLRADVDYFKQSLNQIISLTESSAETLPEFRDIRTALDDVLEDGIYAQARESLASRHDFAARTVATFKTILMASLAIGVLLGIGGLVWVRGRITHPVDRLMSQIARQGEPDSTGGTDLGRSDEFGVLARSLADAASQRAALEEELRRQALQDPLTKLPNRTLFKDRVELAIGRQRGDKAVAVAFLDLDDFKNVNDSLGHAAGDELLIAVARRLKENVKTSDTAARLGGDEFAVLLEDVDDICVPAQRILQAIARPIQLQGNPSIVQGSVGIARHEPGQSATDLLRNADVAMYAAKSAGKSRFKAFDQTMHAAAMKRFDLKNEMLSAVAKEQFSLHYQPIMDLATLKRTSVEALIRWDHPSRGQLLAEDFIPLAEETGAIIPIGSWVLDTACAQVADWRRSPDSRDLRLNVNVASSQLGSRLVADVGRALSQSGLPAEALVLEITESAFLLSDDELAATVGQLAELGVVIALDEFGSGYSSLGYISKLPIGILKIDRSFVEGIDKGPEEAAVALAIIRLGHTLKLQIIAEGIETDGQLAELRSRGCHLGQGFLLGRPVPPKRSAPLSAVA